MCRALSKLNTSRFSLSIQGDGEVLSLTPLVGNEEQIQTMKTKVGVMGSAEAAASADISDKARALAQAIGKRDVILLTGATTGVIHLIGKTVRETGTFHLGISPGASEAEHLEHYGLPVDACDALVFTGFGLKGRNVVLVRSCDIVLFVAGSIGSLNEFTIAYDEGKVIGCLTGSGGVADEAQRLVSTFQKRTKAQIFYAGDPEKLLVDCLNALSARREGEVS
jgi:uncharacterized protein (TIGR00725 family)